MNPTLNQVIEDLKTAKERINLLFKETGQIRLLSLEAEIHKLINEIRKVKNER